MGIEWETVEELSVTTNKASELKAGDEFGMGDGSPFQNNETTRKVRCIDSRDDEHITVCTTHCGDTYKLKLDTPITIHKRW